MCKYFPISQPLADILSTIFPIYVNDPELGCCNLASELGYRFVNASVYFFLFEIQFLKNNLKVIFVLFCACMQSCGEMCKHVQ